jgi:flavin-dependent dehydrogenase
VFEFKPCCSPGYAWAFPLADDHINFGVCTLARPAGQPLASLAREHAQALALHADGRLRGAREATWSGHGRRWHHPAGILSCGDAAGLSDPDTGEGIAAALLSGQRAGQTLAQYLHDGNLERLESYSRWILEHFSGAYQPGPFRRIWAALARSD